MHWDFSGLVLARSGEDDGTDSRDPVICHTFAEILDYFQSSVTTTLLQQTAIRELATTRAVSTMAAESSSNMLSPEAFLKLDIPPRCPSVNSPIVSPRPKSDRPDSQQLCLWKWPARHIQGHDKLDKLFRRYRYHTVPDDLYEGPAWT